MLKKILALPQTRNLDIDSPECTRLRKSIITGKGFLKRLYQEWYDKVSVKLPDGKGAVLEIGSGAGFLDAHIPGLITSEVFFDPRVRIVLDGSRLPFAAGSIRAIILIDVLHHLPRPELFFEEASRCIISGGRIIMIEPWITAWSKFVYSTLHHEPCRPESPEWSFPSTGPLSGANSALPWILFSRDRDLFQKKFPTLRIMEIKPIMPFSYLLSGGISMRSLMPGWSFPFWRQIETMLNPFAEQLAMFSLIVLQKR